MRKNSGATWLIQLAVEIVDPKLFEVAENNIPRPVGYRSKPVIERTEETVTEDLRFPLLISEPLSIRNQTTQTFNDFGQALTFEVDLYSAFQLEGPVLKCALDLRPSNIARYIPEVRGWPSSKKPKFL